MLLGTQRQAAACSRVSPVLARLEKGCDTSSHSLDVREAGAALLVNHGLSQKIPPKNSWCSLPFSAPHGRAVWVQMGHGGLRSSLLLIPLTPCHQPVHNEGLVTLGLVFVLLRRQVWGRVDFGAETGPWEGLGQSEMVENGLRFIPGVGGPQAQWWAVTTCH